MSIFKSSPTTLSVKPSTQPGTTPVWLKGKPKLTWIEIPNTRIASVQGGFTSPGGNKDYVCAYSGACVKKSGSEVFLAGGGHADYAGNEVYTLRLQDDSPVWVRRNNPTPSVPPLKADDPGVPYYSDNRPASRHTYWHIQYIDARDRMFYVGGAAIWGNGGGGSTGVDAFNPNTNDYDPRGAYPSVPSGTLYAAVGMVKDKDENVWILHPGGNLYRWNQSSGTTDLIGSRNVSEIDTALGYDPIRHRLVRFDIDFGAKFELNSNGAESPVTFGGLRAAKARRNSSVIWCEERKSFLIFRWNENNVYECDPVTFAVSDLAIGGTKAPVPKEMGESALYGRWFYAPELNLCGYIRTVNDNVWVFQV
ncbi:MAG: hypothetical protein IT288_16630 [Bdellovibrionales bacterium]|nr:hypothetical protein [Bdellovibrionales bacterium]